MKNRDKIEQIKRNFERFMSNNSEGFRRAIIRRITSLYQVSPDIPLDLFASQISREFKLPSSEVSSIITELRSQEARLAMIWDRSFDSESVDFEKFAAASKVDFREIESNIKDKVVKGLQDAARHDYGFYTLRQNLLKDGVGEGQVTTLANTALAQFDNAYMFEHAQQAGITKYKYDGPRNPETRPFCLQHLGKIFFYEEILAMDNGQGLDVLTSLGGYNCVHYWTPVIDGETPKFSGDVKKSVQNLFTGFEERGQQALSQLYKKRREYYVSDQKAMRGEEWAKQAMPFAIAHDSGRWLKGTSSSEKLNKHKELSKVLDLVDYKKNISDIMNSPESDVYLIKGKKNVLRYIIRDEETKWTVQIDKNGLVRTAFRQTLTNKKRASFKSLGKLKNFIGDF